MRFTLGIAGFDDGEIPRVLGLVGLASEVWNIVEAGATQPAQLRSEIVGVLLCLVCIALPSIGRRLEAASVIGRQSLTDDARLNQCFLMDETIPTTLKQEIAWSTYALLTCANIATIVVTNKNGIVAVRGFVEASLTETQSTTTLRDLYQTMFLNPPRLPRERRLYLPAPIDVRNFKEVSATALHPFCSSLFVVGFGEDGLLMTLSDIPDALSSKERAWIQSIGQKMEASYGALEEM